MPSSYTWSEAVRRYRNTQGRFVPSGQVLKALEKDLNGLNLVTDKLTGDYRAGRISLDAFRAELMEIVKHVHLGSATLAKGGRAQMQPADYGRVGQIVREQYGFLDAWVKDIVSGEAPLDGRLTARARQYVTAARPTYVAVRQADVRETGFDQEKSVLSPAEHCGDCISQDAIGWQPIGQMIPIGDRQCRSNDKCRVFYRNSQTGEEVAA
jgi:hypothetical protein